jgi:hypothetical protein
LAPPVRFAHRTRRKGATFQNPFGTTKPPHRRAAPRPSRRCCLTWRKPSPATTLAGNLFGPFLFGGYDINNKLPYTENWTFDLQYQAVQ